MKKVAIIITRGGYNNLLQACEWAGFAAASGMEVSGFFRDEAAGRMTQAKVKELTITDGYRGREAQVREILRHTQKTHLPTLMEQAKETGNVKFSVCKDSLGYFGIRVEELIPELDEVQSAEAFWKESVMLADQVLTF